MKVYVVKNKQTKEYQTVVMDFIPDIRQSDIFIDYEVALAYCPSDCEVVECELLEKNQLADYTKQVRKEVFASLKEKYKQKMQNALDDFDEELGHINCDEVLEELLEEIGFNEVLELYQSQKKWYS